MGVIRVCGLLRGVLRLARLLLVVACLLSVVARFLFFSDCGAWFI